MSLSNEDTFRAQNSINLSIALVAAAFALMAGVLAAFFAVADKIPETGAGTSITVFTIIAIGLCLVSVFFGGRGVSKTIKAVGTSSNKLPEKYDGGSFGWQGITGILGTVAVVLMIAFSINIRAHHPEATGAPDPWRSANAALAEKLEKQEVAFTRRIDQVSSAQQDLSARLITVERGRCVGNQTCPPPESVAAKKSLPRRKSEP